MRIDEYLLLAGHEQPEAFANPRAPRHGLVAQHTIDAHAPECSVFLCERVADLVLIMLPAPTIVVPFCEEHAAQARKKYADLIEHLPEMSPEEQALFSDRGNPSGLRAHLTPQDDERELRDDDEPEGAPRSADER